MNDISLDSKLPHIGTSIFTVMSALAHEHEAINLSQGFPDFHCDRELVNLVAHHLRKGHNQYAPMPGLLQLREQISLMVGKKYGMEYDPESEITITSGATEAIFDVITALVGEDDEVIVMEPAYDCYVPAIQLNGGQAVGLALEYPDYKVNWDQLKRLVNGNTKAIILNSPHNPTGAILSESDLKELENILKGSDIFVISDEVYEHIVFDGKKHESVCRYPELAKRAFIVSSFGKSLHTTGWKLGYCLAPAKLTTELRKIHQFVTFSSSTPFQYAIADYLASNPQKLDELSGFYQNKRDLFLNLMEGSGFKPIHSAGTYFQLMSYEGLSDKKDLAFAQELTSEYGVASIPVSGFYRFGKDDKVLRFCFAKEDKTLIKAAKLLQAVK